jgi:hypothetical protein
MSYQPEDTNTGLFSSMAGKRMAFLAVIIIIGGSLVSKLYLAFLSKISLEAM